MEQAASLSEDFRRRFADGLCEITSDDISVVAFGSLARDEFARGSDVDWTALVDGGANPGHLGIAKQVRDLVKGLDAREPGQEGIFGNIAFSHDIIHQIGGEDDTNQNTTRRILLVLESRPIGRREAYDRVLNQVLTRYVDEARRFLETSARYHIPRFLLNDFARYWRTMAVDFAYKRRTRGGRGAAIRNIKLRISRKLIYVSGLLACFSLHLLASEEEKAFLTHDSAEFRSHEFVRYLRELFAHTPLEILASVINRHQSLHPTGVRLFRCYDNFLGVLSDAEKRNHLNLITPGDEPNDPQFQELRRISHEFRDALLDLFFSEQAGVLPLTKTFGVF